MEPMSLCVVCKAFDISSVFVLARERIQQTKPKIPGGGGFPEYEGFPKFYEHHRGLHGVFENAENGCRLCKCIWNQFSALQPATERDRTIRALRAEYLEQVHVGLTNWSPEAQGYPYLAVTQDLARGAVRNLALFDVFAQIDVVPKGFENLVGRAVQPNPASELSLSIATRWLEDCMTTHRNCKSLVGTSKPLPSRVVDVGGYGSGINPRIVVTNGMYGEWAALSYCWGGQSTFVLNGSTLTSLCKGDYTFEDYPATLQDAVRVTRALNIRYLWIDALCIQQDSPEDWAKEAARMKDVYGEAKITISAANSPSTSAGMLQERLAPVECCELEWKDSNFHRSPIFLRSGSHFWDASMKGQPLNKRGWTLQESLLSPRTLSYTAQQTMWECQERKFGESGRPIAAGESYKDKRFMQSVLSGKLSLSEQVSHALIRLSLRALPYRWASSSTSESWDVLYSRWYEIVRDFTTRSLTVETDALPALSGVAAAFQRLLGDQYCAGLWKLDLVRGLLWSRPISRNMEPGAPEINNYPSDYKIPSWSWASVRGGLVSHGLASEQQWPFVFPQETARIVNVRTVPRLSDPFGKTSGGYLVIKAPFCHIENPFIRYSEAMLPKASMVERRVSQENEITTSRAEYEQQHRAHLGQEFAMIRMIQYHRQSTNVDGQKIRMPAAKMMMLETVGNIKKEYRRIGLIEVAVPMYPDADDEDSLFLNEMKTEKWPWKEVRIV